MCTPLSEQQVNSPFATDSNKFSISVYREKDGDSNRRSI